MTTRRSVFPQPVYARFIVKEVLPRVDAELARWRRRAAAIPDEGLRRQAEASMAAKRFHAEGGGVYGALAPQAAATLIPLIVALQTISDYLDNLCDRSGSTDEANFRRLHEAMRDAVDGAPASQYSPSRSRYYALHPHKDDGGYLENLVGECRRRTAELPSYAIVKPHVLRLVELYNDLQVYKHGPADRRVPSLEAWHRQSGLPESSRLAWWEFAAAAGSTLGVFTLLAAAVRPDLTDADADRIVRSYFPWICGLHILLDYFIDQAEDEAEGDLNFVRFYPDSGTMERRLVLFVKQARRQAAVLPEAPFHTLVVQGLPGLYLSDEKVARQRLQPTARKLLWAAGPASFAYYAWCRRRRGRSGPQR